MFGRYDRQVCSRSLVVFNPLMVNLPPPSSHDGATLSCTWIQLPGFFSSDLSLILLSLPRQACPHCHVSTSSRHPAKNTLMGSLQVNHTRTAAKDQQRLRIYRTRNSKAIGVIISPNLWSSVGLFGCNKSNFEGRKKRNI